MLVTAKPKTHIDVLHGCPLRKAQTAISRPRPSAAERVIAKRARPGATSAKNCFCCLSGKQAPAKDAIAEAGALLNPRLDVAELSENLGRMLADVTANVLDKH